MLIWLHCADISAGAGHCASVCGLCVSLITFMHTLSPSLFIALSLPLSLFLCPFELIKFSATHPVESRSQAKPFQSPMTLVHQLGKQNGPSHSFLSPLAALPPFLPVISIEANVI